jgi:hypothetical protein
MDERYTNPEKALRDQKYVIIHDSDSDDPVPYLYQEQNNNVIETSQPEQQQSPHLSLVFPPNIYTYSQPNTPTLNIHFGNPSTHSLLRGDLTALTDKIGRAVTDLRMLQARLGLSQIQLEELFHKGQQIIAQCQELCKELFYLLDTVILPPNDLNLLVTRLKTLLRRDVETNLYIEELIGNLQRPPRKLLRADLKVLRQPFPKCVKQNSKIQNQFEDPLEVGLLLPPRTQILTLGPIRASIVYEETAGPKKKTVVLLNDVAKLDPKTLRCSFNELRFTKGSGKKPIRLQFEVSCQVYSLDDPAPFAIHSVCQSLPLCVLTNENQWDESTGHLLKRELFQLHPSSPSSFSITNTTTTTTTSTTTSSSSSVTQNPNFFIDRPNLANEITWQRFANLFQLQFIRSTRQDKNRPVRPLALEDLDYLVEQFKFHSRRITQSDFERIWKWIGPILQKLRHQKTLALMWLQGYLYGFVSRTNAEAILLNQPPGTFLLRFSERYVGKIAVAGVYGDDRNIDTRHDNPVDPRIVRHFLIDSLTEKPIPEILFGYPDLTHILQVSTDFVLRGPQRVFSRSDKTIVLSEFLAKKPSHQKNINGYEDLLS